VQKWRLHPLIHTGLEFALVQDVESIRSGAKAPQFSMKNEQFTPTLDMVADTQTAKCAIQIEPVEVSYSIAMPSTVVQVKQNTL